MYLLPRAYSTLTSYAYDKTLNQHIFYRGKDCLSKFSKTLKAQVNKIINILQKAMDPLTEQEKFYMQMLIYPLYAKNPLVMIKKAIKVRDHCHYTGKYRGAAHSACNLQYKIPKSIPAVFHNGFNYDFQKRSF